MDEAIKRLQENVKVGGYFQEDHPEFDEELCEIISDEACARFINNNGTPNFKEMGVFEDTHPGVKIKKGESDSFGWLTGIVQIRLNSGDYLDIVYG